MCDPVSAIGFGLSAAGQVAGFAAKQDAVNQSNAASRQNAVNAGVAASRQYGDEQRRMALDVKKDNQEGYKSEMQARQSAATAQASGASSGMDIRSGTMKAVLASLKQDEAMDQANVSDNRDNAKDRYKGAVDQAEAQAQGRINSQPLKANPSPLGMALGIATSAFDSASSSKTGKKWLGIEG